MIQKKRLNIAVMLITTAFSAIAQQAPTEAYHPDGYSIVTVQTPKDVPFHVTGLDSDNNGVIYAATRLGEVWRLENDKWFKFAEGLHEPTGLLIDQDGSIVVAQKPELTRIKDSDGDGLADEYQLFASGWDFHDNYHEYNFGPVKDDQGNYFGTLNLSHNNPEAFTLGTMGSAGGYRGFAYKVDISGRFEPYAWGLRSPAGIGSSPAGEVFITDNQGDWVPTSKMHLLKAGKFYGHPVSLIDVDGFDKEKVANLSIEQLTTMSEKPIVWIPHIEVANSPGNPEWDTTSGKFGPFKDQIFVADQTQSNIFRVLLDKVNGEYQGAVINFMNRFQSGNIRLNFDNAGQLWVGQTADGWGSQGGKPFGLQKVVWDGTNPFELLDIKLTTKGFKLTFTEALDPNAVIKDSFSAQQWHYHYSGNYGSPKMELAPLDIKQVSLSKDKKSIYIELPIVAGKVVQISFSGLKDINARSVSVDKVFYTLNQLIKVQ